jgi:uncharacterized flavoprotein (TIGR03862 family)
MKKTIAIIGAGPASLMLAASLDAELFDITIYEQKKTIARKFLVAGDGGLNITHSEPLASFIQKYTPSDFIKHYLEYFSNIELQNWLQSIGIETFTGTSKRVFPIKNIKPIEVLNAIENAVLKNNVVIKTEHKWLGWNDNNALIFENKGKIESVNANIVVFGLGGASWTKTGSNGSWAQLFSSKKIEIIPFQASNCAFKIEWANEILAEIEGKALKNISVTCNDSTILGEAVLTKFGIEGNAIYAHSNAIRNQINENGFANIYLDFKTNLSLENIENKLNQPKKNNTSFTKHIENQLNLTKQQMVLLKNFLDKESFNNIEILAKTIKKFPLKLTDLAPIDEAISTVGGVSLNEINSDFELKKLPNHYCIGEMLNWDAPTGGYLLQACFSMGRYLANSLNKVEG